MSPRPASEHSPLTWILICHSMRLLRASCEMPTVGRNPGQQRDRNITIRIAIMAINLTQEDIDLLLASLSYTKLNFESTKHPTYATKQVQFQRVNDLVGKLRAIRDSIATN